MMYRFSNQHRAPHSPRALVLLSMAMIAILALAGCAPPPTTGGAQPTAAATMAEATAEPTMAEPTTEPTAEATMEATEEATAEATEEATAEATMEATEEATMEATAEATAEGTAEATGEATAAATPGATGPATVMVANNEQLGDILVDAEGMTLYLFTNDTPNTSNCYDQCAVNWPPLLTEGAPEAGEGADSALLGTTTRTDGTTQVTYNGWPLYYYIKDMAAGDVTGQDVGGVWYVVSPAGEQVETP